MFEAKFQSFDDCQDCAAIAPRVTALRAELKRQGIDGFILPRADAQQNEYVPPSEQRLAWLTGFSGSAGAAVVLADRAALFVDGRYTVQAREQTDTTVFTVEHLIENPPEAWIDGKLKEGGTLGYDPWLHTTEQAEKLAKACRSIGATLVAVAKNPIDAIWTDRPAAPLGTVTLHDIRYAGESAKSKLQRIRAELAKQRIDTLVVSDPHNVAWTFNIRGSDVAHTPLPLSYALIPQQGRPALYIDGRKLSNAVRSTLETIADVKEPNAFPGDISALAGASKMLRFDPSTGADALTRLVSNAKGKYQRSADPISAMKAVKNETEISGSRAAHLRDGAALSRFLCWFDQEAPKGKLTEISAVEALESFRRETGLLKDVSFPTIAGAGPHAALPHYRVSRKTDRPIRMNEIFLIDSGAQYEDATTDITRTVIVGTPTDEMRERFTLVLKGHIAIARALFPDGTSGAQLDSFARRALWERGLDFDHGTGHGIGSYLSVHEGPGRIAKIGTTPLRRGMILSNEPGYYKVDAYGIRIENLVLVTEAEPPAGAERKLNAFETISLAPIDQRLIAPDLLDGAEMRWLDAYHARVARDLAPRVDEATKKWLIHATKPLLPA